MDGIRERKSYESSETESLKNKLKVKWHQRDFTMKKEDSDKNAMKFFFATVFTLFFVNMFWLIPSAFSDTKLIMWPLTFVILCEVLLNWHRAYFDTENWVKAETKQKVFPDEEGTPKDWKHCIKCQLDAPPRSHHCQYCNKCMLKRVQHCFITGSCVGFHNQRFFLTFCVWSTIAAAYSMYLQITYLNVDLPITSYEAVAYIPPVTLHRLVMGYISFGQAFLIATFFMCVILLVVSFVSVLWHLLLAFEGVTSYEAWNGNFGFQGSRMDNLRSVFGSIFYLPLILVYPYRFQQLGDGIQWRYRFKRVKGN